MTISPQAFKWQNVYDLPPHMFVCGHCENHVGSNKGYGQTTGDMQDRGTPIIYICPACGRPNFFERPKWSRQVPATRFGTKVEALPDHIAQLYEEAMQCTSGAFTACVLACRKLLIHLAVQEGAKPNLSFVDYIDYLANKGYVPPNGKIWVDHIRKKGNEANHEIVLMSQDDARELLSFVEMLLKFMYEFPARINAKAGGT